MRSHNSTASAPQVSSKIGAAVSDRDYWAQQSAKWAAEKRERARQRAARQKHLRQILNERGFYAVLRQLVEGGDAIGREDQLRILKTVEEQVQAALRSSLHKSGRRLQRQRGYRNSRLGKIEALIADPSTTDGERAAAQEALNRLRRQSSRS